MPVVLSRRAESDLKAIIDYTLRTWGKQQMLAYMESIDAALLRLADNPHLGHPREDLSRQHKAYAVGEHIIIYKVAAKTLVISRILHSRMDFPTRFRH